MSARELIELAGQYSLVILVGLCVCPGLALLVSVLHPRGQAATSPWKYLYAVLVYLACVPGILAVVLTAYSLFFANVNLLDVNLIIYIVPIVSMGATLLLIRRAVAFAQVPGFDRLWGLMVMLAAAFVITLALARTRIWLVFGGSIAVFFALAALVFGLLKWGAYMFSRRSDQPAKPPPGLELPK